MTSMSPADHGMTAKPRLTLSIDVDYDWLSCLEFGFVDDGIPTRCWRVLVDERVALAHDPRTEEVAGFSVLEWSTFDAAEHEGLFADALSFAVPQLGLRRASVGEICLAAKAWLGDNEPTLDRAYFHMAMAAPDPGKAIETWLLCLEAGCLESHYSLGYTYYELGDFKKAYRHLRAYTELAPWNGWAWCWYGKACIAVGEPRTARGALNRALEIERAGGHETEADELLDELEAA